MGDGLSAISYQLSYDSRLLDSSTPRLLDSQWRRPLAGAGDLNVPTLSGGGLDGVHHLQDVVGEVAAGPVR
jgi:hypothetical protein